MSMSTPTTGPVITESVQEVQGIFPSDAALQDAIAQLTLVGFDRADFSLPIAAPTVAQATPEAGAETPNTEADNIQMRTMHTSMAASVGAIAAAGITIATGGLAVAAVGAAVAAGAGAGLLANAASSAASHVQHEDRETAAAQGQLVLSVRAPNAAKADAAMDVMRRAGASRVEQVIRDQGRVMAA